MPHGTIPGGALPEPRTSLKQGRPAVGRAGDGVTELSGSAMPTVARAHAGGPRDPTSCDFACRGSVV